MELRAFYSFVGSVACFLLSVFYTTLCLAVLDFVQNTRNTPRAPALEIVYSSHLRPKLHITPPDDGWLNDPNGLLRDEKGIWHVYYQYHTNINPDDRKDWGHATSKDLWHWHHHPIAIEHDETWGIWSGSVVIDTNNTSGLFPANQTDGIVAIYTQAHLQEGWQMQALAFSLDGGYTFKKYAHNPVLDIGSQEFRDPKVFWYHATKKWIMVVAHAADREIGFYSSPDLKTWRLESKWSIPTVRTSDFECPGLSRIPYVAEDDRPLFDSGDDVWILLVSSGSGSPLFHGKGSVTHYFVGTFNGTHFKAIDDRADRVIDFGPDNYATAIFHNVPETRGMVTMGWATNLAYAGDQPSGQRQGWRGILTSVRSARLVRTPDGELRYHNYPIGLRTSYKSDGRSLILKAKRDLWQWAQFWFTPAVEMGPVLINIKLKMAEDSLKHPRGTDRVPIEFFSDNRDDRILCHIEFHGTELEPAFFCDRSRALGGWTGPAAGSLRIMSVPKLPSYDESPREWNITMILDRSIFEVFLNGGLAAGTMTVFPRQPFNAMQVTYAGPHRALTVEIQQERLTSFGPTGHASETKKRELEHGSPGAF